MMPITTRSSINVKPLLNGSRVDGCRKYGVVRLMLISIIIGYRCYANCLRPAQQRTLIMLPQIFPSLNYARDPQHHLRLVGHAGGRFARRIEGVEFCPRAGGPPRNVARRIPRGVFPAVHEFLRPPHAARADAATRGMVPCQLPAGAGFGLRTALRPRVPRILPCYKTPHLPVEHRAQRVFCRAMPRH